MTDRNGTPETKRRWEAPAVRRIGANRAENGTLIGSEAVVLLS